MQTNITEFNLKNAVSWDLAPCGSCKDGRFGATRCLHLRDRKKNMRARKEMFANRLTSNIFLARVFFLPWRWRRHSPPVLTRSTRRHIPKYFILHNHLRENLKSQNLVYSVLSYFLVQYSQFPLQLYSVTLRTQRTSNLEETDPRLACLYMFMYYYINN
jgi:hypothetical protein